MSDVIDLRRWAQKSKDWQLSYIDSEDPSDAREAVVRVSAEGVGEAVAITFPRHGDGARFDGMVLSPAQAREMAIALIECAGAVERVDWLGEGKKG